ncbi:D-alanine--D-alanine ligase family protein [Rubritalea marina]|uniref:D-alanine--D-alanine ligase family protein n=1 Tax=Rubritalea marina TaxID=361055 RepID=UPI000380596B|nr:D-alanine--D-alanine ligase [Rubritalea marina]
MNVKECNLVVAMGGPGSEKEVSMATGQAVAGALREAGCKVEELVVETHDVTLPEHVDLVVNTIHGTFGEDGQFQSLLEEAGIAYTGAGSAASKLAFDKVASKERFIAAGVPTPKSEILDSSQEVRKPSFDLPYVVKPPCEGSSVGVHIVQSEEDVEPALKDAATFGEQILVEQFVEGKELTVGVLGDEVLPVVHIAPRSGFYDMANKYPWMTGDGGTDYYCPADLDETTTAKVQKAALEAHRSLGIEVYSRVDVLLGTDGEPYVLEVNTIPGMTASSLLPKAAEQAGYSFPELCLKIAELSAQVDRNG